jgi:triosephosphate isomerase
VGETLAEREAGHTAEVLVRQVRGVYEGLDAGASAATVIAYEPVWCIGTGKVATLDQAGEAHAMIRSTLDQAIAPELGREIAILYGGSVSAENAPSLFSNPEIDGALVGGASLEAAAFVRIVMAAGA